MKIGFEMMNACVEDISLAIVEDDIDPPREI
jgi:hypothetical protein